MLATILPIRSDRVVLATARKPYLEGNLLHLHDAIRRGRQEMPAYSTTQLSDQQLA